jgi:hypothetical protein
MFESVARFLCVKYKLIMSQHSQPTLTIGRIKTIFRCPRPLRMGVGLGGVAREELRGTTS